MSSEFEFAHDRLNVYQFARELLRLTTAFQRRLPRGETEIRDQLKRAGDSVLLNTAEGAGRSSGADKARFYDYARGSGAECAAILDVLAIRELAPAAQVEQARGLLHQIVRMLTALARNARSRASQKNSDPRIRSAFRRARLLPRIGFVVDAAGRKLLPRLPDQARNVQRAIRRESAQ